MIFLITLVIIGLIASVSVVKESFDFSKKKYNFYINLLNLDEKATEEYAEEVNTFTTLLAKENQESLQELYDNTVKYGKKS